MHTESALIHGSIKGNADAQYELYRRYIQAMYNTVIRMIPNKMDAEDILQESFVKVFQNLSRFKGESSLGTWIKRIVVNTALNHIRKNRRIQWMDIEEQVFDHLPEEQESITRISMDQIHHAIKGLPEGCRLVLSLFLLEGYQHKEIAQILEITESTSKTQYRRARHLLQDSLKQYKAMDL